GMVVPVAESLGQNADLEDTQSAPGVDKPAIDPATGLPAPPPLPAPENATAMPEPHRVWIDKENKRIYADGYVSLREGMLEMFACPVGTKEHESIVAVYSRAQVIHAALLAIGAEPGQAVQFRPEFKPPEGPEIEIEVRW